MWTYIYAVLCAFAVLFGWLFTLISRKTALKFDVLDMPRSNKAHKTPTPLLGGLGVSAAFFTVIGLGVAAGGALLASGSCPATVGQIGSLAPGMVSTLPRLGVILAGGFAIVLLGLFDDKFIMRARTKFAGQLIVALAVACSGIKISLFFSNPFFNTLLTVLWIVAVINSFNLLDNVDGLCAGIGAVGALMIFIVSIISGQFFVACFSMVFIGALLGFLIHNFPPAKIFLGDAGSMFVGYIMAILTMVATYYDSSFSSGTPLAVCLPIIVLAVPIFDTLSVIVIRVATKKPIYIGDKNHFSHRLMRLGLSNRQTVVFLCFISLSTGLGATLLLKLDLQGSAIVLAQTVALFAVIGFLEYLGKRGQDSNGI